MNYYLNPFVYIRHVNDKYIANCNGNDLILLEKEMEIFKFQAFTKDLFVKNSSEKRFNLLEKNHIITSKNLHSRMGSQYVINEGWFELSELDHSSYKKITESTILILGCGGLGTHISWNMCALGVKKIILVDNDTIETNNLNRQMFYTLADIGRLKTEVLKEKIEEINKDIEITIHNIQIKNPTTDLDFIFKDNDIDLVIKALDTPINHMKLYGDYFQKINIPYVSGSTIGTEYVIGPSYHPTLKNKFRESPFYNITYPDSQRIINGKGTSLPFIMSKIASNVAQEAFYILIDRVDLIKFNEDIKIESILKKDFEIKEKNNNINATLLISILPTIAVSTVYQNNILNIFLLFMGLLIFLTSKLQFKDYFIFLSTSTLITSSINGIRQLGELPHRNLLQLVSNIQNLTMSIIISMCFYTIAFLLLSFFFNDIKERMILRHGKSK